MLPRPEVSFLDSAAREPGKLRIAVTTKPYLADEVHPDCVQAIEEAVTLLRELGHEVVEDRCKLDGDAFGLHFLMLIAAEVYASFRDAERDVGRKVRPGDFEEQNAVLEAMAQTFTGGELAWHMRELNRMGRQIAGFVEDYDVVLNPTVCTPPPKHGFLEPPTADHIAQKLLRHGRAFGVGKLFQLAGGPTKAARGAYSFAGYSMLFNISGNPSMSVPLHWNGDGLPVGVMFTSRLGDEATLLSLAGQLERAKPWWERRPPQR
jgi:amidase